MTSSIPSKLMKAVKAAPKPGLELVLAMLSEGRLDLDEPIEGKLGLMDTLIDQALYESSNRTAPSFSGTLIKGLFSLDTLDQWLLASENKAFARKDRNGTWVPLALLHAVETTSANSKNFSSKGQVPTKKELDKWCSKVAATLPNEFWEEAGGAFLAKSLSMDLHATVHQAWTRISPLSLDSRGIPALLSAKSDAHWLRFIGSHEDPETLIEGEPLWKILLEVCKEKPARPASTFLGAFEDWFVQWAGAQPSMKGAIQGLVQARVGAPLSYSPERWVNLFKASPNDWSSWSTRKNEAVWACVARGSSLDFFRAMDANPQLIKKIDRNEYAKIKMLGAIQAFATTAVDPAPRAKFLGDTLRSQGWNPDLAPYASRFARLPLEFATAQSIRKLATDEALWFGPSQNREMLGRELFLMLPDLAKEGKPRLQAWLEIVSGEQYSDWLSVGRGFASAIRGKMEDLQSVSRPSLNTVASDPGGMAALEDMGKNFAGARRKEFNAWLESVKLEVASPRVQMSRSSPRL
jgi:hypothetical protein